MKLRIENTSRRDRWAKPCALAQPEPTGGTEQFILYSNNFYYYDDKDELGASIEVQKSEWKESIQKEVYGSPEFAWEFWEEGSHIRGKVTFTIPVNDWYVEVSSVSDLLNIMIEVGPLVLEKTTAGETVIEVYDDYRE